MWRQLKRTMEQQASDKFKKSVTRFFKEQYTNTVFMGLRVPQTREAIKGVELSADDIRSLLNQPEHELRLAGLLILMRDAEQYDALAMYLELKDQISNWDLVDASASILKPQLLEFPDLEPTRDFERQLEQLERLPQWYQDLCHSRNLWHVRIAVVSLLSIKKNRLQLLFWLSSFFVHLIDQPDYVLQIKGQDYPDLDLIEKAIGWILREGGKEHKKSLIEFLDTHIQSMHKTTISYCTERLTDKERVHYRKSKK